MKRILFCDLCPAAYAISVWKGRLVRNLRDLFFRVKFAARTSEIMPAVIYNHKSLIRRQLGNVDLQLQENKAVNLALAVPKISGVLIRPGETFSFWRFVGACTPSKGYLEGLTITGGKTCKGIGGGMCQFTNLLHWLVLHSPLDIVEHHHHDGVDLFPDFDRQVPFGVGTSIFYNYLDYRVKNNTDKVFQFIIYTTDTHLCGELRSVHPLEYKYHIVEEEKHFVRLEDGYYRRNKIYKSVVDKHTGMEISRVLIKESNAKVMYDEALVDKSLVKAPAAVSP